VLIKEGRIIALAFFTMILQLLLRSILFELVINVFAQLASLVPIDAQFKCGYGLDAPVYTRMFTGNPQM